MTTRSRTLNRGKVIFGYPLHTGRSTNGHFTPPNCAFFGIRGGPRRALFVFCVLGLVGVLCDWPHLLGIPDEHIVFAHAMGFLALGLALGALNSGCDP